MLRWFGNFPPGNKVPCFSHERPAKGLPLLNGKDQMPEIAEGTPSCKQISSISTHYLTEKERRYLEHVMENIGIDALAAPRVPKLQWPQKRAGHLPNHGCS